MMRPRRRSFFPGCVCALLCVAALTACVPAAVPPQLDATPGPAVIVADRVEVAGLFSVQPPAGWRIITSAAGDPPSVLFIAPDDAALIGVGTAPDYTAPALPGADHSAARAVAVDGVQVQAALRAPADAPDVFIAAFERVIASLRAAQP